jgi:hypothetical protein
VITVAVQITEADRMHISESACEGRRIENFDNSNPSM